MRLLTLSNMTISAAGRPNSTKFYFIRAFITSRTSSKFGQIGLRSKLPLSVWKNPNRLIMGKMLTTLSPSFLFKSHLFLKVTRTCMKCVENISPSHIYHKELKNYYTLVGNKQATKNAPHEKEYRHFIVTLTKRIVTLLNDPQVGATLRDVIVAKHFFLLS